VITQEMVEEHIFDFNDWARSLAEFGRQPCVQSGARGCCRLAGDLYPHESDFSSGRRIRWEGRDERVRRKDGGHRKCGELGLLAAQQVWAWSVSDCRTKEEVEEVAKAKKEQEEPEQKEPELKITAESKAKQKTQESKKKQDKNRNYKRRTGT
jgi:hypothetical protein